MPAQAQAATASASHMDTKRSPQCFGNQGQQHTTCVALLSTSTPIRMLLIAYHHWEEGGNLVRYNLLLRPPSTTPFISFVQRLLRTPQWRQRAPSPPAPPALRRQPPRPRSTTYTNTQGERNLTRTFRRRAAGDTHNKHHPTNHPHIHDTHSHSYTQTHTNNHPHTGMFTHPQRFGHTQDNHSCSHVHKDLLTHTHNRSHKHMHG